MNCHGVKLFCLFSVVFSLLFTFSPNLTASSPTPAQLQKFRSLSKQQQQELMKQMGYSEKSGSIGQRFQKKLKPSPMDPKFLNEDQLEDDQLHKQDAKKELLPFGYSIFNGQGKPSFQIPENIPVPDDYIVGPGDVFQLYVYGKDADEFELIVSGSGSIAIPNLKPISVSGMSFKDAKALISSFYEKQHLGEKAYVSLLERRSVQVYVVGEVKRPGTYELSSLSTVTHALFSSGGPTKVGSLRKITVKRHGKVVARYDFYDFLLNGVVKNDIRLEPGDVIHIPVAKRQVILDGAFKRPAIYEVNEETHLSELIQLAGGSSQNNQGANLFISRYLENGAQESFQIQLKDSPRFAVQSGDYVVASEKSNIIKQSVWVFGHVQNPGFYQWRPNLTFQELLKEVSLLSTTDEQYVVVINEKNGLRHIGLKAIDLTKKEAFLSQLLPNDKVIFFSAVEGQIPQELKGLGKLEEDDAKADLHSEDKEKKQKKNKKKIQKSKNKEEDEEEVEPVDNYIVSMSFLEPKQRFELFEKTKFYTREQLIYPILKLIEIQSSPMERLKTFEVRGSVKYPGFYPLTENATIDVALRAAGGLIDGAYIPKGHLNRMYFSRENSNAVRKYLEVSLQVGTPGREEVLQPKDVLNIFNTPNYVKEHSVTLQGEVKFPGVYTISPGDGLREAVLRAGGFNDAASLNGAVFTRKRLIEKEEKYTRKMANTLSKELALISMQPDYSSLQIGQIKELVDSLNDLEAVGRLVINLDLLMAQEAPDIVLEDGDVLYIPSVTSEVNVIGEVQVSTAHLYHQKWSVDEYIQNSGGLRSQADSERIYVIKRNGLVVLPEKSNWFSYGKRLEVSAGDTIVVPLDAGHLPSLTLWQKATQIIYQSAVAVAAISNL
ncbi:polysaccharide biosynthesis/export family protein [Algicola sagamiensis]|uniref:polysaccharide biosynthesis/export family protein n=1 Tax=Algicola sagamiensis TaxID=163869 RepID=UPI00035F0F03|nr:SLBB domain-containing protein [Algicola sagamiensis]